MPNGEHIRKSRGESEEYRTTSACVTCSLFEIHRLARELKYIGENFTRIGINQTCCLESFCIAWLLKSSQQEYINENKRGYSVLNTLSIYIYLKQSMMMMMIFYVYFLHLRCYRWLQMSGRVPELGNKGSQFHEARQTLTVLLFERVSLRETEIERQRKCLTRGTCKHLSSFYLLLHYKQSTYLLPSPIPLICFAECTVCWQSPELPRVLPDINIINSGARRGVLLSWKYKDHGVTWSQLHTHP